MAAYGLLETKGLTDALEALDAMCKSAMVELLFIKFAGGGLVTIVIKGDTASVTFAVEAGKAVVRHHRGEIICSCVIPSPHPDLVQYLNSEVKDVG